MRSDDRTDVLVRILVLIGSCEEGSSAFSSVGRPRKLVGIECTRGVDQGGVPMSVSSGVARSSCGTTRSVCGVARKKESVRIE